MSKTHQVIDHPAIGMVGTSVGASVTTASLLGALPVVVSVTAGLLTIIFMAIQIALAIRTWRRGHDLNHL